MATPNTRMLTPGVTRRVRTGARAANAVRIEAATSNPVRQDVSNDPSFYQQLLGVTQTIGGQPSTSPVGNARPQTTRPVAVDSVGEWRLNAMTRQPEWVEGPPQSGLGYRLGAAQQGITPATPAGTQAPTGFGGGAPPAVQRVDPQVQTGNPSVDDLRSKMAASERDAQEYAGLISRYTEQIDEANRLQLLAIQEGATEIASQYDEQIAELQGRIAEARIGLNGAMAAYKHWFDQVGPAYEASVASAQAGEAAQAEAMEGRVARVEGQIASGYEQTVESLEETAELIGAGAVVLDGDLASVVDTFEDMITSAAAGRIEDVDRISAAAAKFATAQAQAVGDQDKFLTDLDKQKLEIQIQSQIDTMIDNVTQLEKDKARAVQAALDQYDPQGYGTEEESWNFAMSQYIADRGWSIQEEAAIRAAMASLDGVSTREDAIARLMGTVEDPGPMMQARSDGLTKFITDSLGSSLADSGLSVGIMERAIALAVLAPESADGKDALVRLSRATGVNMEDALAGIFREADENFDGLLDVMDMRSEHLKTWNEARAATASMGMTGSQAPQNYVNRNQPTYVQRRTVGVPKFAAAFQAAFGKEGTGRDYIGGVTSSFQGALRLPSATGGGKSSNSDHLSGGALDLYGSTVAELEAIERWARQQPGVSLVVYSGNKFHETGKAGKGGENAVPGRGHVHVSLQVGYW